MSKTVSEETKTGLLVAKGTPARRTPKYIVISCKCVECAIVFKIYTEHADKWRRRINGRMLRANCPECTCRLVYLLAMIAKQGWIFDDCPEKGDADYIAFSKRMINEHGVDTRG